MGVVFINLINTLLNVLMFSNPTEKAILITFSSVSLNFFAASSTISSGGTCSIFITSTISGELNSRLNSSTAVSISI